MAQAKGKITEEIPKHRILREVYRHYLEFRQYVSDTGNHVIEHGYFLYDDDGKIKDKITVKISFWDLFNGLKDLSPRKREAVWYNVILDQKQRDVAKRMQITTVSVGQYVEQAMLQLSEHYFADELSEDKSEVEVLPVERDAQGSSVVQPATEPDKVHRKTNRGRQKVVA